jgi:hypothetical protein
LLWRVDLDMNQLPADIESELIDLNEISMTTLRELDDIMFRQAMWSVMQRSLHPQVAVGGGSGERVD